MNTFNNKYSDLIEAIKDLNSRGYSKSFILRQDGLYCIETKEIFKPINISIVEYHRFEGATDFEDMSIMYVIETDKGINGTITDAYGTYANSELGDFLQDVKIKEK